MRIRRLRELDMPLDGVATADLPALAEQLGEEIERLQALRERALELAASETDPSKVWADVLRRRGLLSEELPARERPAIALLDALHPDGIDGVIEAAARLVPDGQAAARLSALVTRLRALPDDAPDELVDALAADWVATLPPVAAAPLLDADQMERLLDLPPAKRRCVRRIRELRDRDRGL